MRRRERQTDPPLLRPLVSHPTHLPTHRYNGSSHTSQSAPAAAADLPPHLFKVADKALSNLMDACAEGSGQGANQSIIISGEVREEDEQGGKRRSGE